MNEDFINDFFLGSFVDFNVTAEDYPDSVSYVGQIYGVSISDYNELCLSIRITDKSNLKE